MLNILINGACGQMGRAILRLGAKRDFNVLAGIDKAGGADIDGVSIVSNIADAPKGADVVVDFSRPAALEEVLAYCTQNNVRLVIGTTGLNEADHARIRQAAQMIPIFQSGNMSLGVNLQIELAKTAAATLGDAFDIEITEKHHNRKVDAPSGTALMLANAVSTQFPAGREYVCGRHTSDVRRKPNEIGLHAIRGGTVVGEHAVEFFGEDEVVAVTHKAYSKQVFAAGALRAAQYLMHKQPGLYNMHDLVTEQDVLSHVYTEEDQAVINVGPLPHEPGMLHSVFDAVAEARVFVDMISIAAPGGICGSISFSVKAEQAKAALTALQPLHVSYPDMEMHCVEDITKLTVEGPGMAIRHGVASEFFEVLAKEGISIELVTTSETKIACCIRSKDVGAALTALAKRFSL